MNGPDLECKACNRWALSVEDDIEVAGAEALEPAPDLPVAVSICPICGNDEIWYVVDPGTFKDKLWCGECDGFGDSGPRLKRSRPGPEEPVEPKPVELNHEPPTRTPQKGAFRLRESC